METEMVTFLEQLFALLNDLTVVAYAVPLITLLVSIVKRAPFLANVQANVIHLILQVVFWLGYAVVTHFGHGEQLQEWTVALTALMETLLPLIVSLFGGTWLYSKATQAAVPLLGYKRT